MTSSTTDRPFEGCGTNADRSAGRAAGRRGRHRRVRRLGRWVRTRGRGHDARHEAWWRSGRAPGWARSGWARSGWARSGWARLRVAGDAGMATAEYAIATIAAAGFAGLLVVVLRSDEVRGLLTGLVRTALSM